MITKQLLFKISKLARTLQINRPAFRSMSCQTMDSGHATVTYVTIDNEDLSKQLARQLVESKLAACVNLIPSIRSIYEWEGKIGESCEILMIIKSHSSKSAQLVEFVEEHHTYDCPEVITLKVESGSQKYLEWVSKYVTQKSD